MEHNHRVEKKWRTHLKKDELLLHWRQSGQSRRLFCSEQGLTYNSFVTWYKQHKAKAKRESGFSEVVIKSSEKIVAQLHLSEVVRIDFYQPLSENIICALRKQRKNYLLPSSHQAAQNAAMFYSLLGTCKLKSIEPFEWLKSLFEKLLDWKNCFLKNIFLTG